MLPALGTKLPPRSNLGARSMPLLRNWNVLCWNIRGMNSDKKLLALSNAISVSGYATVCLQETKKPAIDLAFIKTFCPNRFNKFALFLLEVPRRVFLPSGIARFSLEMWLLLKISLWASDLPAHFLLNPGLYIIFIAHVRALLEMILPPGFMIWTSTQMMIV